MGMTHESFADVVVHIGYHKAGSTLLQSGLFIESRGVFSEWPQDFYHRHLLLDRPDSRWATRVRAAFAPGIAEARSRRLVPVLSCEALSGDMWRLGQANGFGNFHVADLLAEAFPQAKVAVVHREQVAMICSLYKHSLRSHWRFTLTDFLDQTPLDRGMAPVLNFGYLEYSWLLEHYQRRFGADRVLALPFELLRHRAEWARLWAGFMGVAVDPEWFDKRENPGFSALTARRKRVLNYLIPAGPEPNRTPTGRFIISAAYKFDERVPPGVRKRSDDRLRRQVVSAVGTRFAVDNARLAALSGVDLSTFDYPTDERATR